MGSRQFISKELISITPFTNVCVRKKTHSSKEEDPWTARLSNSPRTQLPEAASESDRNQRPAARRIPGANGHGRASDARGIRKARASRGASGNPNKDIAELCFDVGETTYERQESLQRYRRPLFRHRKIIMQHLCKFYCLSRVTCHKGEHRELFRPDPSGFLLLRGRMPP